MVGKHKTVGGLSELVRQKLRKSATSSKVVFFVKTWEKLATMTSMT